MSQDIKKIQLSSFEISNNSPLTIFAGPCQMESYEHSIKIATEAKTICDKLGFNYVFKASFDKANRTSISGKRGIGLKKALEVFSKVKEELKIPVITDIHEASQCKEVAKVVDILQIPAFLCRQTDLLLEAANTRAIINVKKGQFLAPNQVGNIAEKIATTGNDNIIFTERGVSFGYNNLVVDMRSFPIMKKFGYPVFLDATHSTQAPGGLGASSGGDREMAPYLAQAAVATGIAGLFLEVHEDPDNAPSDGPCMIKLQNLEQILTKIKAIDVVIKEIKY